MLKKSSLIFFILLGVMITIIPVVNAENVSVTPATTPFITIDPIGNHTAGDVFFINGTTNIPAGENLSILVEESYFNPSGYGSYFESKSTIKSGKNGVNYWSCNITPILWTTSTKRYGPIHDIKAFQIGDYTAGVYYHEDYVWNQSQIFTISFSESNATSTIPLDTSTFLPTILPSRQTSSTPAPEYNDLRISVPEFSRVFLPIPMIIGFPGAVLFML
jgi:hypothetical protein